MPRVLSSNKVLFTSLARRIPSAGIIAFVDNVSKDAYVIESNMMRKKFSVCLDYIIRNEWKYPSINYAYQNDTLDVVVLKSWDSKLIPLKAERKTEKKLAINRMLHDGYKILNRIKLLKFSPYRAKTYQIVRYLGYTRFNQMVGRYLIYVFAVNKQKKRKILMGIFRTRVASVEWLSKHYGSDYAKKRIKDPLICKNKLTKKYYDYKYHVKLVNYRNKDVFDLMNYKAAHFNEDLILIDEYREEVEDESIDVRRAIRNTAPTV